MSQKLIEILSTFQDYMLMSTITILIIAFAILLLTIDYNLQKRRTMFLGIFVNLDTPNVVKLSCVFLKLLFIVFCVISMKTLNQAHYLYLVMLIILINLLKFKFKTIPFSIINNVLLVGGLIFANIISEFINQVRFELDIAIVYWLWGIFLMLYAVYIFLNEIGQIMTGKRVITDGESQEN